MYGHLQSSLLIQRIHNVSLSHFQEFERAFVYSYSQQASPQNSSKYIKIFYPLKQNFKHLKITILFHGLISASNYCSGPLSETLGKIQMEMSLAGAF